MVKQSPNSLNNTGITHYFMPRTIDTLARENPYFSNVIFLFHINLNDLTFKFAISNQYLYKGISFFSLLGLFKIASSNVAIF